jgi:hypothetical protein
MAFARALVATGALLALGASPLTVAEERSVFRYDQHAGQCLDRQRRVGLNPGGSRERLRGTNVAAECTDFGQPRSNLTYLHVSGANLKGASFAGASFYLGTFADSDFRGANLDGTSGQVDYSRSDLRGASFRGADLRYSVFDGALLEGARFDDATRLPFSRSEAEARGMRFVPASPGPR